MFGKQSMQKSKSLGGDVKQQTPTTKPNRNL